MATTASSASSADFDFVELVESRLHAEGVSLTFFARLKLRNMYKHAIRHMRQTGAPLDHAAAQGSASRLAYALVALKRRKINGAALGSVFGFLCPGLYPIC